MAISQEMINQAELAKAKIVNSGYLDDDSKKNLLNIVAITTQATNGISPEEKIQKMTESVLMLTISQVQMAATMPKQIQDNITKTMIEYGDKKCSTCRAMLHVDKCDKEESLKGKIEDLKEIGGMKKKEIDADTPWAVVLKQTLLKPYPWILASLMVFSPYGVDILKTLAQIFGK